MNALNEIGSETFKTDLIQCGFFRFHPDSFGSVGGLRPSSEGEYLQKGYFVYAPSALIFPAVTPGGEGEVPEWGLHSIGRTRLLWSGY